MGSARIILGLFLATSMEQFLNEGASKGFGQLGLGNFLTSS